MSSGEIDLRAYFRIFKKRLWFIIFCVVIFTFAASEYSNNKYQPIYQASTKLLVNKTVELNQLGEEQMDFQAIDINVSLIDTYKEIIKTPVIMEKVVQRYPELNLSAEQLISKVDVNALNGTQVMSISTQDFSHERAVLIVNAVSEIFKAEIPKILKVDNVTILNEAKILENPQPINEKQNTFIILGFMASLAFAVGVTLLLESIDDTLKTEEDIRKFLGISTLSKIPKMRMRGLRISKRKPPTIQVGEGSYVTVKK